MPRRTKLTIKKAGTTKKTVKPKVKKIAVEKVKKDLPKTAKAKPTKAQVVLESIAQEEKRKNLINKEVNISPLKSDLEQVGSVQGDLAKQSKSTPDILADSVPEKLNKVVENAENKDVANEIYAGETEDNAKKEIADKEQKQELINNEETAGKSRSLGLYRKIALSFIILTVILLVVIAYFSFVKITIVLIPNQERISSNLILDVFDQDKRSAVGEGEVIGVVKQVEVEQSKTYPATDIEVISEEVIGKVILINNYNKNQPLVAITRLLSPDNKLFRIKKTVNVPAGGQLEVEVYADEPGQDMIIGPTHFTIPGLWAGLQDEIYGESKESMKYSRQVKKHIKQADIDKAVKDLKQILLDKATTEVSENYQTYDQAIYDIDNNSISQQVDGKVGDEVEEFTITMKTMVIVVAFMDDEIYKLARQKFISVLPDDKQLLEFSKDEIGYSLNNYNIHQGTASLNINFAGKMIIKQAPSIVNSEKLVGLNREQISAYLNNLPEVASYDIKFYPSFIKKAPSLVDRIELIIKK